MFQYQPRISSGTFATDEERDAQGFARGQLHETVSFGFEHGQSFCCVDFDEVGTGAVAHACRIVDTATRNRLDFFDVESLARALTDARAHVPPQRICS